MKCSKSNVMMCSFSSWYKAFEDVTVKSIVLPLPDFFVSYLHADGVVLPESSSHGIYTKSANTAMDGDEDDPDIRDDELMKMYEDDWSTPDSSEGAKVPDFGDFDESVKEAIKSLGGKVFPKLNWSSPKDANWISFDKTLMCTCPSDIYLLLKSSEFIAHDLDQPFVHCDDAGDDSAENSPSISYCLVLKKWQPPDPSTEFRCFVHDKKLIALCQRQATKFFSHINHERESIISDISKFHQQKIAQRFSETSYVFDVVRPEQGKVILVDFNPFGLVTDSLLYSWEDIEGLLKNMDKRAADQTPDFRCVESEGGVQTSDYANYALPRDIQDLTSGEDPYKLMDLLKLRDNADSSSEDEEETSSENASKETCTGK
ncbi:cell division cycle protein 123 homolog [Aplysia californica]|uniref:Cell division cycle protein 123 homolog n=1 Tax=Aplysia californica TaxID=6500 RepID=A0ABM0JZ67_APLCA|nr:cell division cycle protein 123 homolog [Aplysia californica]